MLIIKGIVLRKSCTLFFMEVRRPSSFKEKKIPVKVNGEKRIIIPK